MTNVIQFLESMGRDAAMAKMSAEDFNVAVSELEADEGVGAALCLRDHKALADILAARPAMICMIATPGEAPIEEEVPAGDAPDDQKESAE